MQTYLFGNMLIDHQLNDPSLLHEASLLNGEWVQAQSNKTFEILGKAEYQSLSSGYAY